MVTAYIKQEFRKIPGSIKQFAKRALLLLAAWLAIYSVLLQPHRLPDKWLTSLTAVVTAKVLNHAYQPGFGVVYAAHTQPGGTVSLGSDIQSGDNNVLFIADGCNALDLFALYVGFICCIPTTGRRAVVFAVTGIAIIFILNILRCYALVWLNMNNPAWVDFAHHYAFTLVVYAFIFAAWVIYAKKYNGFKQKEV